MTERYFSNFPAVMEIHRGYIRKEEKKYMDDRTEMSNRFYQQQHVYFAYRGISTLFTLFASISSMSRKVESRWKCGGKHMDDRSEMSNRFRSQ